VERTQKRAELQQILIDGIEFSDTSCLCGLEPRYIQANMKALQDVGLWGLPLYDISIIDALEKAAELKNLFLHSSSPPCRYGYKHPLPNNKRWRKMKLKGFKDNVGLCLGCLRSGRADVSLPCGIDH
jgi:hypothetical protein